MNKFFEIGRKVMIRKTVFGIQQSIAPFRFDLTGKCLYKVLIKSIVIRTVEGKLIRRIIKNL